MVMKNAGENQEMPENNHQTQQHSGEEGEGTDESKVQEADRTGMRFHQMTIAGVEFTLSSRYEPVKPIGVGAFGAVISANDIENNNLPVAIKKISKAFRELLEAKRLVREIRALRFFDHPHIISIMDILPPPSLLAMTDVYVITDLMETDLHRVVTSNQTLTVQHIKFFLFQILSAVMYIHSCGVIHRDIKPSNILINQDCTAKLCDFGLCRSYMNETPTSGENEEMEMTQYVVTRWYRAPEIMLCHSDYSAAIDIWSLGCIYGELLCRRPLFPGKDYIEVI